MQPLFTDIYHSYYFQVQAQLKFCSASYADFVVWTDSQLFVQQIYPDEPFITNVLKMCNTFIKIGILPDIIQAVENSTFQLLLCSMLWFYVLLLWR